MEERLPKKVPERLSYMRHCKMLSTSRTASEVPSSARYPLRWRSAFPDAAPVQLFDETISTRNLLNLEICKISESVLSVSTTEISEVFGPIGQLAARRISNFMYSLYMKLEIDDSSRLDEGSKMRNSEIIVKSEVHYSEGLSTAASSGAPRPVACRRGCSSCLRSLGR